MLPGSRPGTSSRKHHQTQVTSGNRTATRSRLNSKSRFHGLLLGQDSDIPYVGDWNLITPSEQSRTTLAIEARGSYYEFLVDNREVFSRQVDDISRNVVAVGVTVLANGLRSAAVCQYDHVVLRVHPGTR